jgi:site-specific DNA recombinase
VGDRAQPAKADPADLQAEETLRPRSFNAYVGQQTIKDNLQLAIKAALNRAEIRQLKRRINDRVEAIAMEGRPISQSYGYRTCVDDQGRKSVAIVSEQAEVVREAAARELAGEGLSTVARGFNARGVPTARGGVWRHQTLKSVLTAPMVTGLRTWRGQLIEGIWEPILDRATWHEVGTTLATSGRKVRGSDGVVSVVNARERTAPRQYLLTRGLADCGHCGVPLIGQRRKGHYVYTCVADATRKRPGCGKVTILAEELEDLVRDSVLAAFESPKFLAAQAKDDQASTRQRLTDELGELARKRSELAAEYSRRGSTLSFAEVAEYRAGFDRQEAEIQAEFAATPPPAADTEGLKAARKSWPHLSTDQRRALLEVALTAVIVRPHPDRRREFLESRVLLLDRTGQVT